MDLNNMIPKETEAKIKQVELMVNEVGALIVTNNEQYAYAGDLLKRTKGAYNEIDTERKKITKPLDEAKAGIMAIFNRPLTILADAESKLKSGMLVFVNAEEKKRKDAEAKLQAEARAKELKDKEKLEAKATKSEAKGDTETADALRMQAEAVTAPVPTVQSSVAPVDGVGTMNIWKYQILDVNLIPREYMIPNEKMLGQLAKATKGALTVAGIKFYSDTVIASRGVK